MRLLGIVFVLLVAGCGQSKAAPAATPSPVAATPSVRPTAGPSWVEQMTFSGDLSGLLNQVQAPDANTRSECTGRNSRGGGTWASSIYGPLAKGLFGVTVVVGQYRGPGTYSQPQASVQVHKPGDPSVAWQSVADDPVRFVVNNDEESGTVEAILNNLTTGKPTLKLSGSWTCKT